MIPYGLINQESDTNNSNDRDKEPEKSYNTFPTYIPYRFDFRGGNKITTYSKEKIQPEAFSSQERNRKYCKTFQKTAFNCSSINSLLIDTCEMPKHNKQACDPLKPIKIQFSFLRHV